MTTVLTEPAHDEPPRTAPLSPARRTGLRRWPIATVVLVLLSFFIGLPLVLVLAASFTAKSPLDGFGSFTFANYSAVFHGQGLDALKNSAVIGIGAGSLAMVIGTGLAWLAARTNMPGRKLAELAGILPLFISGFVGAMAWSLLASPRSGALNLLMDALGIPWHYDIYSLHGIVLVEGLYYSPYAYLFLAGSFSMMNPELEEAAAVHGARQRGILRHVTGPLSRPALLSAGVLIFALVIEDFPIPVILGSGAGVNALPSYVYELMATAPAQENRAGAVGVLLVAAMAILVVAQRRMLRGQSYTTVSGKGFRPRRIDLGKWRWPAFALVLLYIVLAVVLPVLALAQTAFSKAKYISSFATLVAPANFTTGGFVAALNDPTFLLSVRNSLIVCLIAGIAGAVLHFLVALYINRSGLPARRVVAIGSMAPAAVPALVFGVGMLWMWTTVPGPVYGSLSILAIAYVVRFTPQGVSGMSSGMHQIDADLENAALVSGASRARSLTWVTVPLLRTSIASTALLLFILSMRELSASIFLYNSHTRVLSVTIFEQWENGQWPAVATFGLVLSAFLLVLTLAGRRWLRLGSDG
jgi:iron(III) transport system permease protein